MKTIGIFAALMFAAITAWGQPQTLLEGDLQSGGFGGISIKGTSINSQTRLLAGMEGAWVVNHAFYIGVAGYGMIPDLNTIGQESDTARLDMGYAGGLIGFQFFPDNLLHFGVHTLVGAGVVHYEQTHLYDAYYGWNSDTRDIFFVVEPGANAELNVSKSLRLDLMASYRFVSGVEMAGTSAKELSGPSIGLTARFGWF